MQPKIYPVARRRMIEICHYPDNVGGEGHVDKYIHGLWKVIEKAATDKYLWRKVEHEKITGIYFVRYEHHYIFFRELSKGVLGAVNVLHERMDIPARLKDDWGK